MDLQKILEKVQTHIQDQINQEVEKKELGGNDLFRELEKANMPEDFFNNEGDKQKLIQSVSNSEPMVAKTNQGLFSFFKQTFVGYAKNLNLKYNKIQVDEY